MQKAFILTICLSFMFTLLRGQLILRYDSSVKVENHPLAFSGGFNSAQFQKIDLNNDNVEDLVVFDRTSESLSTYIFLNSNYKFSPGYSALFPHDIEGFFVLADYNCDGKKDIFTHTTFGLKVYKNISENSDLNWQLVADPLYTQGSSSFINLQVNKQDIPGISDVDNDGDTDILVYNFSTGGYVEFHKNLSRENFGNCDSLLFKRVSTSWGEYRECDCNSFGFGGDPCIVKPVPSSSKIKNIQHVGGKSLLLIDMDNDADKDLISSHEECPELYFLKNEGNIQNALFIDFLNVFPDSSRPAVFPFFPTAFYEDMDGDGLKDLIVSPNTSSNLGDMINFQRSSWFYKNTGSSLLPSFKFQQEDFLQDQMIDLGENASPAFFDFDGDGDEDLFISHYGNPHEDGFYATVCHYENTGSKNNPLFRLLSEDFMSLSNLKLKSITINFTDLNGDSEKDMVLGAAKSSISSIEKNYYSILNTGTENPDFKLADTLKIFTCGINDQAYFTKINSDKEPDLLLAKTTGRLEYYENKGNYIFTLKSPAFLGITDNFKYQNPGVAIDDLNSDGKTDLVTSDASGILKFYSNIQSSKPSKENLGIFNDITRNIDSLTFIKTKSWLAIHRLYDNPSVGVGTLTGGIILFRNNSDPAVTDKMKMEIWPVPSKTHLNFLSDTHGELILYTSKGQEILRMELKANETKKLNVSHLREGLYFVKTIGINGQTATRKIIIGHQKD